MQYGSLSGPFGPVVDGLDGILPDTPKNRRDANKFLRVKVIAGITKDEGAYYASETSLLLFLYNVIAILLLMGPSLWNSLG